MFGCFDLTFFARYGRILTHNELKKIDYCDTISFENWNKPKGVINKFKCYLYILKLYIKRRQKDGKRS